VKNMSKGERVCRSSAPVWHRPAIVITRGIGGNDFMKALIGAKVTSHVYSFSQKWDIKQIAFIIPMLFQRDIIHAHISAAPLCE
jgi:hypothetical protein